MTSDESFSKRGHLLKTRDYRRVYKEGRSFKGGAIVISCLANNLKENRVGFSISSRNVKLANRRNKIRRRLREMYRRNRKDIKKGFDMVFIVKREIPEPEAKAETKRLFLKLAKQAGILL